MRGARPDAIPSSAKRDLRILLMAKHARWDGGLHPEDGTHATYHREMRQTLERIGLNLSIADSFEVLFTRPDADFVFPLLNRGGFLNSEMLVPLLCTRLGLPFLGATPILRGLADDKHLAKRSATAAGIPTAPWAVYRRGAAIEAATCPVADRYVIKPNASSASWGVSAATDWAGVKAAIVKLHDEGHDAIVEPFIPGHDIEVSVITNAGQPLILPTQIVEQDDPSLLRSSDEKRNLTSAQAYEIRPLRDAAVLAQVEAWTHVLMREYQPFDYGRFEFRIDTTTGAVSFLEVNLNCNLWSKKTISMAAAQIGWAHEETIETILASSLRRQGLVARELTLAA